MLIKGKYEERLASLAVEMGGKAEEARVLREEARQLREEVTGKKRLEILLQDMREKLHHLGRQIGG
jgi:hypothetical protein